MKCSGFFVDDVLMVSLALLMPIPCIIFDIQTLEEKDEV